MKNPKSYLPLHISSIFVVIAMVFCCYLLFFGDNHQKGLLRFRIVIDGGSTGTRIHVFGYRLVSGKPVVDFKGDGYSSMKVNPGLSAHAEDPDGAGGSLTELMEFAKEKVPREMWRETEIRLMATAGMRLLDLKVQERILEVCRRVLGSSGFKFRDEWASVISGSDEGVYAWVVANFALGTLGGDPLETTGIFELGGASAQVTFVSSEPMPPEFSHSIMFENHTYNLYTHSFLHLGQNVAFESFRESLISGDFDSVPQSVGKVISKDPCTPKGYSIDMASWKQPFESLTGKSTLISSLQAGGNFSQCRSAALELLQKGNIVGSTFMPKLQGNFLATENFFYTSKFFGLGQNSFLSDLMTAGEQFCGEGWSELKNRHPSFEEEVLLRYCFSSAYIVALLHDSLGIALDDERIGFANQVGDIPLGWALGAFILQTTSVEDAHRSAWFYSIIGYNSTTLLYLIGIPIILLSVVWSLSKWRKPQLKTVYDLEKGRYIVTRIR